MGYFPVPPSWLSSCWYCGYLFFDSWGLLSPLDAFYPCKTRHSLGVNHYSKLTHSKSPSPARLPLTSPSDSSTHSCTLGTSTWKSPGEKKERHYGEKVKLKKGQKNQMRSQEVSELENGCIGRSSVTEGALS